MYMNMMKSDKKLNSTGICQKTDRAAYRQVPVPVAAAMMIRRWALQQDNSSLNVDKQASENWDWGKDLTDEAWLIDELKNMKPISLHIPVTGIKIPSRLILSYREEYVNLDGDRDGFTDDIFQAELIREAMEEGLCGLIHGGTGSWLEDGMKMWMGSLEDSAQAVRMQMEEIEDMLLKVLPDKSPETGYINILCSDLAKACRIRDEWNKRGRLTGYTRCQTAMEYGNVIIGAGNETGLDLFQVIHHMVRNCHFPWKHQEVMTQENLNSYFLSAYFKMAESCRLTGVEPEEMRKLEINGRRVLKAYVNSPFDKEERFYEYFRTGGQNIIKFTRVTDLEPYFRPHITPLHVALFYPEAEQLMVHTFSNGFSSSFGSMDSELLTASSDWEYLRRMLGNEYLTSMRICGAMDISDDSDVYYAVEDDLHVEERSRGFCVNGTMYNPARRRKHGADQTMLHYPEGREAYMDVRMSPMRMLLKSRA